MNNKLAIAIVALMVAVLAAPAVMGDDVDYIATVTSGQSTSITGTPNGAFNAVDSPSNFTDNVISDSITCENVGNADASVNAKFITNVSGSYGLTTTADDLIDGSNFELGNSSSGFTALTDNGDEVPLGYGVPAMSSVNYDARLKVDSGQAAGEYTGTVQLIFS